MSAPEQGASLFLMPGPLTWGSELCSALVDAQGFVSGVGKDKTNSYDHYKYASAEALIEEARTSLAKAGLAALCTGTVFEADGESEDALNLGRLRCFYLLLHRSGQYMRFERSTPVLLQKIGRPEDKAEATASTYDLGYFLRGLLLLSRQDAGAEDVDQRDDSARAPVPRAARREPERRMVEERPPTPTERHFAREIAAAATLEQLDELKAAIKASGLEPVGLRRLGDTWLRRVVAVKPAPGEVPPAAPSSPRAAVEEDWGDRAKVFAGMIRAAKSAKQLELVNDELRGAIANGMPGALSAPLGMQIDTLRTKLGSAEIEKAAKAAQSAVEQANGGGA